MSRILGFFVALFFLIAGLLGFIAYEGDTAEDLFPVFPEYETQVSDDGASNLPGKLPGSQETSEELPASVWEASGEECVSFADSIRSGDTSLVRVEYDLISETLIPYSTDDPDLMNDLFQVLDSMPVTGTTDMETLDDGDILRLEDSDGNTACIGFSGGNLNGVSSLYTVDDYDVLKTVLDIVIDNDMFLDDGDDNFILDENGDLQYVGDLSD